jgi:intracellular multiplication protein IcmB
MGKWFHGALDTVEDALVFVGGLFGTHANNYCDLETQCHPNVLVTPSGNLVSSLSIRGISHLVGSPEFEKIVGQMERTLAPLFSVSGHHVQWFFQRDGDITEQSLHEALLPAYATAERVGLDITDVLLSKEQHLARLCATERLFITLWTTSEALSPHSRKEALKRKGEVYAKNRAWFQGIRSAQNLVAATIELLEIHLATVAQLKEGFEEAGFFTHTMTGHEMLREVRQTVAPHVTPYVWSPCLPGDAVPRIVRGERPPENDLADLQYPPVRWQIFPSDFVRTPNQKFIEVGNRVYAPLLMEMPPTEVLPFSKLFTTLQNTGLPYRVCFLMEPDGLKSVSFKASMAGLLVWAGTYNKQISEAVEALKAAEFEGKTCVKVRVALCTWVDKKNEADLPDRAARLAKAITAWGKAEVREVTGDAMMAFISSVPMVSMKNLGNPFVAPLEDVVRFFPVDRLASSWETGGVVFRTMDGRMIPFEPGSSSQTTWNYLFFARPGMGKSVLMAAINTASCVKAGQEALPFITYIDIGPSSQGFVGLIQDALPEHQKHLCASFKLRLTPEYAVNVFDTHLGQRKPFPDEKTFLVAFLTLLATPPEKKSAHESMSSLASKVVEEVYAALSDHKKGKPKRYSKGANEKIDAELAIAAFPSDAHTTWWEVADHFFEQGDIRLSLLAQRYAMPTLVDTLSVVNQPQIYDLYKNVTLDTGENLCAAFQRIISDKIRDLPTLSAVTQFDLGQARVVAIDLDEVAKSGEGQVQQNAIFYMLARYLGARNVRLHADLLVDIRSQCPKYSAYFEKKIDEVRGTMKWIIYDEFHRTASAQAVRDQVLVDMREGRKWNLGVMLASQSVEDFDSTMKEFASGIFILNAGNTATADKLQSLFGFNDTAKKLLVNYANGPTAKGAPFLAQFATKKGTVDQFLVSSISPIEAWAFSTTAEDVLLRNRLYLRMGPKAARHRLARAFPGGSAKETIERRRLTESGFSLDVLAMELEKDTGP